MPGRRTGPSRTHCRRSRQRSDELRELSPFWYAAEGVDSIVVDGNAPTAEVEAFLAAARDAGARIVPSVVDALEPGEMATLLADPAQRARHVEALADFAASGDFAGLDIDYEQFAFADDRSTWITTRPSWVAFIEELAERLHADGRTLTVSIPPVYDTGRTADSGYWVYDYAAIAPLVDRIRVMAYDYSTASAGPIAPLDWVQQAIDGTVAASGDAGKLVLGIPAYGYNWVVATTGTCPDGEDTGSHRRHRPLGTRARPPAPGRARVRRDDRGVGLHLPAGAVGRRHRRAPRPARSATSTARGRWPAPPWPRRPASAAVRSGPSATRTKRSGPA